MICFCANVGQGEEDFEAVKTKAIGCGASKVYIEDLRKEFVTDFVFPAVQCNAIYESRYLLGERQKPSVLSHPLIYDKCYRNIDCETLYCQGTSEGRSTGRR